MVLRNSRLMAIHEESPRFRITFSNTRRSLSVNTRWLLGNGFVDVVPSRLHISEDHYCNSVSSLALCFLHAAFVASRFHGAFPPVDFPAVCFVRAIASSSIHSPLPTLHVGIVTDEAFGRRVFSGIPRFPALAFRRCFILSSFHPYRLSRPASPRYLRCSDSDGVQTMPRISLIRHDLGHPTGSIFTLVIASTSMSTCRPPRPRVWWSSSGVVLLAAGSHEPPSLQTYIRLTPALIPSPGGCVFKTAGLDLRGRAILRSRIKSVIIGSQVRIVVVMLKTPIMPESHRPDEHSTTRQKPQPRPFCVPTRIYSPTVFTDATRKTYRPRLALVLNSLYGPRPVVVDTRKRAGNYVRRHHEILIVPLYRAEYSSKQSYLYGKRYKSRDYSADGVRTGFSDFSTANTGPWKRQPWCVCKWYSLNARGKVAPTCMSKDEKPKHIDDLLMVGTGAGCVSGLSPLHLKGWEATCIAAERDWMDMAAVCGYDNNPKCIGCSRGASVGPDLGLTMIYCSECSHAVSTPLATAPRHCVPPPLASHPHYKPMSELPSRPSPGPHSSPDIPTARLFLPRNPINRLVVAPGREIKGEGVDMMVIEVNMERRRNEVVGETGDPRENPLTNGIVRHDSYLQKSGDPAED
ncbi:hypothetical protein PR048_026401 [Dryococelus australis]|uniref:Uncharacterized protein n=1 Tax=Dryococelus australis TaxID=614101 RepID=A0ABQ9GL87_9NEOP|nr:hypothetical protein PR048_026401 [Dryococelus australis]